MKTDPCTLTFLALLSLSFWLPAAALATGEEAPPEERFFSLNEVDEEPRMLQYKPLYFPEYLAEQQLSGRVLAEVVIDHGGRVTLLDVREASHPGFIMPALESLSAMRFSPPTVEGEPVLLRTILPIAFPWSEEAGVRTVDAFTLKELDQLPRELESARDKIGDMTMGPVSGRVRLALLVDPEGRVKILDVVEADDPALVVPAIQLAVHSKFEPPLREGKAVFCVLEKSFRFFGGLASRK